MRLPVVIVGAMAVFGAYAVFLTLAPGHLDGRTVALANDAGSLTVNLTGTVFAGLAARAAFGRRRTAWTMMTLAMGCWALGDAIWTVYELRGLDPFPSWADVPYLGYSVLAGAALLLFPAGGSGQSRVRTMLDAVIVAASLFIASWLTVTGPIYGARGIGGLEMTLSLAYPLAAIALLTVSTVVLLRSSAGLRAPLALLTAAMALSALSSGFFSYLDALAEYASGNLLDLGWVASALLVVVAAALDHGPAAATADHGPGAEGTAAGWASSWMPYVPVTLAVVTVAVTGADRAADGPVPLAAAVLVVAVLTRQFLADRENRRLLRTISDQALHDSLTGLANRAYFQRRVNRLTEQGTAVTVLALDLDGFKSVNDTFGHAAGDELLVEVAARLQRSVGAGDTVSRLGGDEFVLLLEGDRDRAECVAENITHRFAAPFRVGGHTVDVRFAVGIASAGESDTGVGADELLRRADIAMYEAKRRGAPSPPTPSEPTATISS